MREIVHTEMSSFFARFKEEFKFELKKELDPIIQRFLNLEVEIQNKCSMDDVKQVVIETAKQELQNLIKNITADIITKFEASTTPSSKSSQYLSDIIHKQKNLIVYGIAEKIHLQTRREHDVADLAGGRARGKVETVERAGKAKKDQTTKELFVDSEGSDDEKMILDDDSGGSMKLGELEDEDEKKEEILTVSTGDFVKVVYEGEYFPGSTQEKNKNRVRVMHMAGLRKWKWLDQE
ncbi:hypothetical protein QYM36_003817 [Artemia franciscana]|uniref:Uncharacterized protein n=1 Tax=Artemia franciscana TaxID=6661 RepID=A0AA88I867_ARTSF|nr:hypothetical protein QYM36_003817 [Artemia franciscana]